MLARLIAVSALATGLWSCATRTPVSVDTRVGEHAAKDVVLTLPEPCWLSPGGAPMGRPSGLRAGHTLPAGRYEPQFEDARGVYFASPSGVTVTEPPRGARERPGGIYLPHGTSAAAQQYLGDVKRVTERARLPESCHFSIEPAGKEKNEEAAG